MKDGPSVAGSVCVLAMNEMTVRDGTAEGPLLPGTITTLSGRLYGHARVLLRIFPPGGA